MDEYLSKLKEYVKSLRKREEAYDRQAKNEAGSHYHYGAGNAGSAYAAYRSARENLETIFPELKKR